MWGGLISVSQNLRFMLSPHITVTAVATGVDDRHTQDTYIATGAEMVNSHLCISDDRPNMIWRGA